MNQKNILNKKAAFQAAFLLLLSLLFACAKPPEQVELGGQTMGTYWSAKVVLRDGQVIDQAKLQQQLEQRLVDFNNIVSTWVPDSDISRFNQHLSEAAFSVHPELAEIVVAAKQVHQQSKGFFDVTVAPLIELWGFGKTEFTEDKVPLPSSIERAKNKVGSNKINVLINHSQSTATLIKSRADISINLSAIAKGRGVDILAETLDQADLTDYLVDIGGEIKAKGKNSQNKSWQIAIEQPKADERAVQEIIGLKDISIATSGDYRIFFEIDGQRFSHSIDPNTGWPVKHGLVSVTVLHESNMLADAWATALIVSGPDNAMQLAAENNLAAYFIYKTPEGFSQQSNAAFDALVSKAE